MDDSQKTRLPKQPLNFQEVKVFQDPESKLAVAVRSVRGDHGLMFKRETGEYNNDRFFRGHRTFYSFKGGRVELQEVPFQVFEALWQAAGDFIQHELQVDKDAQEALRQGQELEAASADLRRQRQDKGKR